MADLEDMGYILQPHTSAGRIPSDTGYRFYVDQLMTERDSEHEEKQALIQRVDKMEVLLKQVAMHWQTARIMQRWFLPHIIRM